MLATVLFVHVQRPPPSEVSKTIVCPFACPEFIVPVIAPIGKEPLTEAVIVEYLPTKFAGISDAVVLAALSATNVGQVFC